MNPAPRKDRESPDGIVIFTHEYHPRRGGIATYVRELAAGASAEGMDIVVAAPEHAGLESETSHEPYPVVALPVRGFQGWPDRWRLFRWMRASPGLWTDRLVHLAEPGPLLTFMYGRLTGQLPAARRLVLTFHGSELLAILARPVRRFALKRLLREVDRVCVLSRYCRQIFVSGFPEFSAKVEVVPGAPRKDLWAHRFDPKPPRPEREEVHVLTVARIHPRKGQHEVASALLELPSLWRERMVYRLAGPIRRNRYQDALRGFVEKGLQLEFLGMLEEEQLALAFADSDLFALTSVPYRNSVEGFGLACLEAMAFGLPVIAYAIGGVPEIVVDGETGILIEPGDRHGLREAILRLSEDVELRHRMGEAGRKRAGEFSWIRAASETYQGLAGA